MHIASVKNCNGPFLTSRIWRHLSDQRPQRWAGCDKLSDAEKSGFFKVDGQYADTLKAHLLFKITKLRIL